jgi:hypothetical protein
MGKSQSSTATTTSTEGTFTCRLIYPFSCHPVSLAADISSFGLISQITYEIGVNVIIVWFLVLFFYLKYSFADNSLGVANSAINEKERAFESSALASETKIRKLTKEVAKYKNMADL